MVDGKKRYGENNGTNIKMLSSISIITDGINSDIIFNNKNNDTNISLINSLPPNIIANHLIKFLISVIINRNNNNNNNDDNIFYMYSGNTLSCISPSSDILICNNNNNKS